MLIQMISTHLIIPSRKKVNKWKDEWGKWDREPWEISHNKITMQYYNTMALPSFGKAFNITLAL